MHERNYFHTKVSKGLNAPSAFINFFIVAFKKKYDLKKSLERSDEKLGPTMNGG